MSKIKIVIINGPNLNLLGKRETSIYGSQDFESYFEELKSKYAQLELSYFQSNHEGEIIDKLHSDGFEANGIIINAGAYTHTSIAIRDAVSAIETPCIELHISNVFEREQFRHHSYLTDVCAYHVIGKGLAGYDHAIKYIQNLF